MQVTKKTRLALAVVALVAAVALIGSVRFHAQSSAIKGRNPLSEKAMGQTTWIEEFAVSPDGTQIVFRSARAGNYNLWVVPLSGGEPKALTTLPIGFRARLPLWSPDGKWIAYTVDQHLQFQSETYDVFVIPSSGGEARNLTNSTWSNESGIVWSPDSKYLAFTATVGQANKMTPLLGGGILTAEVASGKLKQISPRGGSDLQWSPDGKYIAYTSNRERTPTFYDNADLYMIPAAGGEERMLTPNTVGFREEYPNFSPDSQKIAFTTDRNGFSNVAVLDVKSGDIKVLTDTKFEHSIPKWSPDGKTIAYSVNQEFQYYIETIGPNGGSPTRVTTQPGINGGLEGGQLRGSLQWLPDSQQIVYTHMAPSMTSDLWIISAKGGTPRRITDSRDPSLTDESRFVWPELLKYKSFDGMEVQGFVYKPKGVTDGDQAPFALFYRANSNGQHPVGWQPFVQLMVSKGYVVFAPNFRGGTGLGKAYYDAGKTWGGDRDIKDAMAGVDLLIARKLIDPNRMAMWGGSTGGFFVMTTLIQRPKAFKAVVCFYGGSAADLVTHYGYSQSEPYGWAGEMIGGTPFSNPKPYYDRSAVHFVQTFESPVMFLNAEGDPSARWDQVRQLVPVFEHFGKEHSEKLYLQEPHGWYHWRPVDVEDALRRVGDYFDEKVLGMGKKSN